MFLPFIHHSASNYNTIFTTLNYAFDNEKLHGRKICIVTFDQPLYMKAREIVAASETESKFSKIIVKLGGFHLLMSFLRSIGYIMTGSGIKEALSVIYVPNAVDKMLNDYAYARAVRDHTLFHLALSTIIFEDIQIDNHTSDFLKSYIKDIMKQTFSYEEVEESTCIFQLLLEQFNDKLNELQGRDLMTKLWIQYFHMVSITKEFIKTENPENWNGHLNAIKKCFLIFMLQDIFCTRSQRIYICRTLF